MDADDFNEHLAQLHEMNVRLGVGGPKKEQPNITYVDDPKYNIMQRITWDTIKNMGYDKCIETMLSIGEYNRTQHPSDIILVPLDYFDKAKPPSAVDVGEKRFTFSSNNIHEAQFNPGFLKEALDDRFTFHNYVLAGGAVTASIQRTYTTNRPGDADFYPLYGDGHDRFTRAHQSYVNWCNDVSATLQSNDKTLKIPHIVKISEYNTQVEFKLQRALDFSEPKRIQKYQLIHRVYRRPEEVIAGFDLACTKCFFDGSRAYGTIDCALALYYQMNVLDYRADSPTHIQRARKYESRYIRWIAPLFPDGHFRFANGSIRSNSLQPNPSANPRLAFENPDEFPQYQYTSAYTEDYGQDFAKIYASNNLKRLPTDEDPTLLNPCPERENTTCILKNQPTYYQAYTNNILDCTTLPLSIIQPNFGKIFRETPVHLMPPHIRHDILNLIPRDHPATQTRPKQTTRHSRQHTPTLNILHMTPEDCDKYRETTRQIQAKIGETATILDANGPAFHQRRTDWPIFIFDSPGKQWNTASFNPIHHQSHTAYWGRRAGPFPYTSIAFPQICTLQLCAKQHNIIFCKDILTIIRKELFRLWFERLIKN